jgi:predicted DNA-binding transcriptional regulator YafY
MRRADRLFQLVQILRRDRTTTAARLAEELGVSERTVYRCIGDLARSGIPVQGEAGVGYALPAGFDVPPLMFTEEEIEALVLGARIVESWTDPALAEAARAALSKIDTVLPARLRDRIPDARLFAPAFHVRQALTENLGPLRTAIAGLRKVRFGYVDAVEARSERTVQPLGLFYWGAKWSLGAYCELRQGFRDFRIDRMADVVVLEERFAPVPGRTLADFFRKRQEEQSEERAARARRPPG